jgi:hypothetical protein
VAGGKLDGTLADDAQHAPWLAAAPFSARVGEGAALAAALPGVDLPEAPWINEFDDNAASRPASDLAFVPASSPLEVRPSPRIVRDERPIWLPYEIPLVGLWWWWRRARRRRASAR